MERRKSDRPQLVAEFAQSLRELRRAAGQPPVEAIARATPFSATTVRFALGGERKPTRRVVQVLVAALGGDVHWWLDRWDGLDAAAPNTRARSSDLTTNSAGMRVCSVEGCPNPPRGRWCNTHHLHNRRYGDPTAGRFSPKTHRATCSVEGCDQPYRSLGLCRSHYRRHQCATAAG